MGTEVPDSELSRCRSTVCGEVCGVRNRGRLVTSPADLSSRSDRAGETRGQARIVHQHLEWHGLERELVDPGNWDTVPTNGSDIVFPAGAAQTTNTDDLGAGMSFGSLTIAGTGYSISASNSSTASFTSIDSSQSSGSNTVDVPIPLLVGPR